MTQRRPLHIQVLDFAQNKTTLSTHPEHWRLISAGRQNLDALVFGPAFADMLKSPKFSGYKNFYWLDSPEMQRQIMYRPPRTWQRVNEKEALALADECDIYFYEPGRRVAPEFWRHFLAQLQLRNLPAGIQANGIWLPGADDLLLHQELKAGLNELGYTEIIAQMLQPRELLDILRTRLTKPACAISVNFRGLDPKGEIFGFLQEMRIPLAIWLVDNPWNLLSAIQLPWWKEARLFVTDQSFMAGLEAIGASHVHFLPLAAAPQMFRARDIADGSGLPLFVGRSAFPDKQRFFAGIQLSAEQIQLATAAMSTGLRPDYHWWQKLLGCKCWPGQGQRRASYGAEEMSLLNRKRWLEAGLAQQMRIVGDAGWEEILQNAQVLPPVDYYGKLAALYGDACWTLNVTSLQLPESLNQRHFDVWAANGFLLTDGTGGLKIFPSDLTEPIILHSPGELGHRAAWLVEHPVLKQELQKEWQQEIMRRHLYRHRLATMLVCCGAKYH